MHTHAVKTGCTIITVYYVQKAAHFFASAYSPVELVTASSHCSSVLLHACIPIVSHGTPEVFADPKTKRKKRGLNGNARLANSYVRESFKSST